MEKKEEIISLDKELLRNPNIKIFPKRENDKINYIVSLDSTEEVESNKERVVLATFTQGNPKIIEQQLKIRMK